MNTALKKVAAVAMAVSVALAGCAAQQQDAQTDVAPIAGGWETAGELASQLSADELAVFDKALEGLVGVDYEPVAVIATQVVAGINRAYLCRGTLVTPEGGDCWYVVTVYEDLDGNAEILDIKELDYANPVYFTGEADGTMVGGWSIAKPNACGLPAEVQDAFEQAYDTVEGYAFMPIALLGTQVVSGTNYRILAYGEVMAGEEGALHILELYVDLDGTASFTSMGQLDIAAYV